MMKTAADEVNARQKKRGKYGARKQDKQRSCMVAVIIVLLLLIAGMLGFINRNTLAGSWYLDDVTVYRFDNNGTGRLILPSSEYEFTYTAKDGRLNIDFVYEGAKDASYEYEVQGNILTLTGGNATNQGVYKLTKGNK